MHFYRRSAPRRQSKSSTIRAFQMPSNPRYRSGEHSLQSSISASAQSMYPSLRLALCCVALCRHPHNTPTRFYSCRLGGLLDRESRQWSTAPTTQVGIRGSPSASEWSTAICPPGQSHTSPSLSVLIRPVGETLSFLNVCDVMLYLQHRLAPNI